MTQIDAIKGRSPCGKKAKSVAKSHSPVNSDDGAVQETTGPHIRCFFEVLEPGKTAQLAGTKFSACLTGFESVNRLKEHMWRAHSPTHNCQYCRAKVTKKDLDFAKAHAACASRTDVKPRGPSPIIFSMKQAENLKGLNQHFKKPNNEEVRCKKLWDALFPGQPFDQDLYMSSDSSARGAGARAAPGGYHNPPPSGKKGSRQPKAASSASRAQQNPTSSSSPTRAERPLINGNEDIRPLFPQHPKPKDEIYRTGPHTLSHGSRDSGIGTMTDDTSQPPIRNSRRGSTAESERRQSSGQSSMPNDFAFLEIKGTMTGRYPNRVDVTEDSALAVDDGEFAVQPHMGLDEGPTTRSTTYHGRSRRNSESTGSRSDAEMDWANHQRDGDEDGYGHDDASSTGDSAYSDDESVASDVDMENPPEFRPAQDLLAFTMKALENQVYQRDWDADSDFSMNFGSEME